MESDDSEDSDDDSVERWVKAYQATLKNNEYSPKLNNVNDFEDDEAQPETTNDEDDASDGLDSAECLRLQHAEFEMLESMYPEELTIADEEAVAMFKSFVESLDDGDILPAAAEVPPNLSFDLKLRFDAESDRTLESGFVLNGLELSVTFPSRYPRVRPSIMLRTELGKIKERRLRKSIDGFMASQADGDLYIANLVEFVKDGVVDVLRDDDDNDDDDDIEEKREESENYPINKCRARLVRMWIYSHHIYSMHKRKPIVEWARELDLNGFSMPGKPGIVCVEGLESAVDEFWTRLRKLNWKRLAVKERETLAGDNGNDDDVVVDPRRGRKFTDFEEISFDVKQGHGRNYHMDMGKFLEFLKRYDCERIFKLYFGVDGSS